MGLPLVTAAGSLLVKSLPFLGQSALIAGGTAAAGKGLMSIPGANDLLNTTASQVAQDENYDLATGKIKGWDTGDKLRSWMTGVSRADVTQAALDAEVERLNTSTQGIRKKVRDRAAALGYQIDEGELAYKPGSLQTQESFESDITEKANVLSKLEQLNAIPGVTATGLTMDSSLAEIQQKIDTEKQRVARETPGTPEYTAIEQGQRADQAEIERADARTDQLAREEYEREWRKWKTEEDDKWRRHQSAQADADKRADRQERALQREQNLQLAIMTNEDKAADRRIAREDRLAAQRQQSIMALMKGLTQMGAGFAI